MAEQTPAKAAKARAAKATTPPKDDRTPAKRTILKRERAIIMPDTLSDEQVATILKAVSDTKHVKSPQTEIVWVVKGERDGESKRKAIEAFAGVAGTPEALPGVWKAPTSAAFSGGRVHERPPEPKIEGSDLED